MQNDQAYLFRKNGLGSPEGTGKPLWRDNVCIDEEEFSVEYCFSLSKEAQRK